MKNVTRQTTVSESAQTVHSTLIVNGLDVDIYAYDTTPESQQKVESLTRALNALFEVIDKNA